MTNEDKKIVAEYMGWIPLILNNKAQVVIDDVRDVYFDLNDAGLIVNEMVKRGEWRNFTDFVVYRNNKHIAGVKKGNSYYHDAVFIAWLFNADNFFTAMAQWIKEGR